MKKVAILALGLALMATPVAAQGIDREFYRTNHEQWTVVGLLGNKEKNINDSCVSSSRWPNGAFISLVQDLEDGELFLTYHNPSFRFRATNEIGTAIFNYHGKKFPETGMKLSADFETVNETTVRFRKIDKDNFLPLYSTAAHFDLILPGALPTIRIGLAGTKGTMQSMAACMDNFAKRFPERTRQLVPSGPATKS